MIEHRQNSWFRYALPAGWRVADEGAFAIALVASDSRALTVMTGNAGMPAEYPPLLFLYERLSQMGPQQLRFGPPRPGRPMAGFARAVEVDYAYSVGGAPCQGLAQCNVAPGYDMATMVATWAASEATQWGAYASWLPDVARDVVILSGAAFGARGVAQQNLENSIALGAQARANREHAQARWAEVVAQRGASVDRAHEGFRENLGNVQTWTNGYGYADIQLPNDHSHYWIDRHGKIVGTDDPTDDPNRTLAGEWSRMKPRPPGGS